jgi:hypothetical protein
MMPARRDEEDFLPAREDRSDHRDVGEVGTTGLRVIRDEHVTVLPAVTEALDLELHGFLLDE